jgi:hypothetical protein
MHLNNPPSRSPSRLRAFAFSLSILSLLPAFASAQTTRPSRHARQAWKQMIAPETDPNSPRHTRLKSLTPDPNEIVRYSLTGNTDHPDVIETWWNGHRVRWIGEGGNMKWTDVRGSLATDALQVDRDGDGYYDGPSDLNVKWVDDDGDGRADVEVISQNPSWNATQFHSGTSIFMVDFDDDHDGVLNYINWPIFEFGKSCWAVAGDTTRPWKPQPDPNFLLDYHGDAFVKQHDPVWLNSDPRYCWENPFLFFEETNNGCSQMSIRVLDTTVPDAGATPAHPTFHYTHKASEAYVSYDIDASATVHNECSYDVTLRFTSKPDGSAGERLDYSKYHHPHPAMKAPQWVLDAHLFRFDNWRRINEFIYLPREKAYDEIFKVNWGQCWLTFDEDGDNHRWEREELYYPTDNYYSTSRWKKGQEGGGLDGHPQSDTLGDRGEWDLDNSGHGKIYIGPWDRKIHLYGAEKGAWTVDYRAKYWGSTPVVGDSSPLKAPKVGELVTYEDTDGNGYFDRITYDYTGKGTPDLVINLLDYKSPKNPHPDVQSLLDPAQLQWQGMHEIFTKISYQSFEDAGRVYRALWKKGLTDTELDNLAIASSTWEQYEHGYWLKEKIFRKLDKLFSDNQSLQAQFRQAYFTGNIDEEMKLIGGIKATAAQ